MKARLTLELTSLDQRFPNIYNLNKLGSNLSKLASNCLISSNNAVNQSSKLKNETKDELLNVIEYHKHRLRVETSELVRELRDANDLDSHLMILESLQV